MFEPVCFLALRRRGPGNAIIPQRCRHILGDTKPITLIYGASVDIYTLLNWREENWGHKHGAWVVGKRVSFRAAGTAMEETDSELTTASVNPATRLRFWHVCPHCRLSATRYTIISWAVKVTVIGGFAAASSAFQVKLLHRFVFAC